MLDNWVQVGQIRWPLRLQEEVAFHNYTNDVIQTALYNAFSSVFDIILGIKHHPLMDFFDKHMKTMMSNSGRSYRQRSLHWDFHS